MQNDRVRVDLFRKADDLAVFRSRLSSKRRSRIREEPKVEKSRVVEALRFTAISLSMLQMIANEYK